MQPLYKIYTANTAFTLCRRGRTPNSTRQGRSFIVNRKNKQFRSVYCSPPVSSLYPVPLTAGAGAGDAVSDPVGFFVFSVNGNG